MAEEERGFKVALTLEEDYRMTAEFDWDVADLVLDEPEPLGERAGPNAARVLGAAIGNCLGASLLFCLRKSRAEVHGLHTEVHGQIVRSEKGRLRIGGIRVVLHPDLAEEDRAKLQRCMGLFEDFCIVTASVRGGIDVAVEVEATEPTKA